MKNPRSYEGWYGGWRFLLKMAWHDSWKKKKNEYGNGCEIPKIRSLKKKCLCWVWLKGVFVPVFGSAALGGCEDANMILFTELLGETSVEVCIPSLLAAQRPGPGHHVCTATPSLVPFVPPAVQVETLLQVKFRHHLPGFPGDRDLHISRRTVAGMAWPL